MSEKAYVMTFKDQLTAGSVKGLLLSFGASVLDPCEIARVGLPETHQDSELFAITLADGAHFPNKHLRLNRSIELAEARGFHVPNAIQQAVSRQLVPVLTINLGSLGYDGLMNALTSFHNREYRADGGGRWLLPKVKSPSRQIRSDLWRQGTSPRLRDRPRKYALS